MSVQPPVGGRWRLMTMLSEGEANALARSSFLKEFLDIVQWVYEGCSDEYSIGCSRHNVGVMDIE
jgi:hypothetical protein